MRVTKVEVQAKHKDRVNVYVDEEFFAGIDMDTCVKLGIKPGIEIDEEHMHSVIVESEKQKALAKAAKYLGKALKSTKQIKDYLRGKGYNTDTINYVIEKLTEYNYLNDEAYVQAYIKDKGSVQGVHKLKYGLSQKGISPKLIDEAFEDYKSNTDDIKRLALKKLGAKPKTYDNLSKVMVFLSNKGYEYDEIKHVVNELREDDGDESWY